MTYRVEYNGSDMEAFTLDQAIEGAKQAIAADVGPVSGWAVEHDETINDWFIQGVADGEPVGSTAVVSGPEPVMAPDPPAQPVGGANGPGIYGTRRSPAPDEAGGWLRSIAFSGGTPAEVFGKATTWLAARPDEVVVSDVGWQGTPDSAGSFQLRIHYHGSQA